MRRNRSGIESSLGLPYTRGPDLWQTSGEHHVSIGLACVLLTCKNVVGWYPPLK